MSQYKTGSVTVTLNSNAVTGSGTAFLANVAVGDMFSIATSGAPYFVAGITTDTALTLTAVYGGATASGQSYFITRDFTTNRDFPLMAAGDIDTPTIYNRLAQQLETLLGAAFTANRVIISDASGNFTTDADLTFTGGNLLTAHTLTVSTGALTGISATLTRTTDGGVLALSNTLATFSGIGLTINTTRAAGTAFDFVQMLADSVQQFRIRGDGAVTLAGTLTVSGNSVTSDLIVSAGTTATVFNTVATTVNAFGAATTVAVGAAASTTTWTGQSFSLPGANSTNNTALTVQNTSNAAAASHAYVDVAVGGTISTGDPHLRLTIPGGTSWYIGLDNSVNDDFEIGIGTAVGTTILLAMSSSIVSCKEAFEVAAGKNVKLGGGTNSVGINAAPSATSMCNVGAGTTSRSSLRIPHGSAPTTPVDGDMWTTTSGLFVRINGGTVGPLA